MAFFVCIQGGTRPGICVVSDAISFVVNWDSSGRFIATRPTGKIEILEETDMHCIASAEMEGVYDRLTIPALFGDVAEVARIAEQVLNRTDVPDTCFASALCPNAH